MTAKFTFSDAERENITAMAQVGIPHDHMAMVLGIDSDTLKKHFKEELALSRIKLNTKIGNSIAKQALEGNITAAIFWAKTQMGWKETIQLEHTNFVIRAPDICLDPTQWETTTLER